MPREPRPHEAYATTVARLVSEGDPTALNDKATYALWMHAKSELGYQGWNLPFGALGRLIFTAPKPLKESDAELITARAMKPEEQEAGFNAFLRQLAQVMHKNNIAPPVMKSAPEPEISLFSRAPSPARSLSPKRLSPKRLTRQSPSPDKGKEGVAAAAREQRRQAMNESREQERQARVRERAAAAFKRREEHANLVARREANRNPRGAPPEPGATDDDMTPGEKSMAMLNQMRDSGQINAAQYQQAVFKVQQTTAPPEPGDESITVLNFGRRSPDRPKVLDNLETLRQKPARTIVWPESQEPEPAPVVAAAPQPVRRPNESLRGAVRSGLGLTLEPLTCRFQETAELTIELGPLLGSHRGDALICVLRRAPKGGGWEPLDSSEVIKMSRDGRCSLRLRQFGHVQLCYLRTLDADMVFAMAEMLAEAVLSGLSRDGLDADAEWRQKFRLGCAAAVQVSATGGGVLFAPKIEATKALEDQVKAAVFAVAERKEKEAAARAAAAAAARAEAEEAAAAKAALYGQLREAAKEGFVDDYEVDKVPLQGVASILAMGIPVDSVDEKGYTALYNGVMYEKPKIVQVCLDAGAVPDKANNNGTTPLMAAARDGFTEIVSLLLEAGADHFQVDEFGRTADSLASEKGFVETATVVADWIAAHPKE